MSNPCSSFSQQETEDQDDDFVAWLVEQMAHSTLDEEDEDGDGNFSWPEQDETPSAANAAAAAAWPPLRDLSAQRRSGWSSTKSSPSPAVSPPTPLRNFSHESRSGDAWELLHLAAKEVMRLKAAASSSSPPPPPPPPSSSYSRDEILAYNRAAMYHSTAKASGGSSGDSCGNKPVGSTSFPQQQQLDWKQQQRSTQRHHSCYQNVSNPITWNRRVRSLQNQHQARQLANLRNAQSASSNRSGVHHPAAAPSSQQWGAAAAAAAAGGSGMRAVFLRGPGFGSSTSNGTGVFLPQATTTTSSTSRDRDQKRKPTCSTVLLPSRIVEVLNLNVDDLNRQPTAVANNDLPGSGSSSSNSSDEYLNAHLSKSYSACSPTRWHSAAEHALPTEWTY